MTISKRLIHACALLFALSFPLHALPWEIGFDLSLNGWNPDSFERAKKLINTPLPIYAVSELTPAGGSDVPLFLRYTDEEGRFSVYADYSHFKMGSVYGYFDPFAFPYFITFEPVYERKSTTARFTWFFIPAYAGAGFGLRGINTSSFVSGLAYYGIGETRELFATSGPEISFSLIEEEPESPDDFRVSMELALFSLQGPYLYDSFDAGLLIDTNTYIQYRATEVRMADPGAVAHRSGWELRINFQREHDTNLRMNYGFLYSITGARVENYRVDTFLATSAPLDPVAQYTAALLSDAIFAEPVYRREFEDSLLRLYFGLNAAF